ncbi:hypothetical protein YQE_01912, partial [Dendroctonus ponderosae]
MFVKPFSSEEKSRKLKNIVNCVSKHELQCKDKKYRFDRVFNFDCSQLDVYRFSVAPMIRDVLAGYNCTVFAYGQTGTGKTHTMIGDASDLSSNQSWREFEMAVFIPRAAANIFEELLILKVHNFNVTVSFLELYNEDVKDLLNGDCDVPPLTIFNDSKGAVCIQNLQSNNHSSRSHVVFIITVHTKETLVNGEEVLKIGKLNLVDLAGSENIAKSGAKDKRAQESANINKSLLTLGRVIQILSENATRRKHGIFVDPENWKDITSRLETDDHLEAIREFKKQQYEEIIRQCRYRDNLIKKAKDCLKDNCISLKKEQYLSKCYAEAADEQDAKFYEYDKFNAKTADKITNTLTNLSQILLAGKRRKEILQKEFDLDIKDEADGILKDVETASHFCINQNNLIEEKKTQLATDFIDVETGAKDDNSPPQNSSLY